MSQTFLVTGGTGRIGTAFVHEIASRGHTVRLGTRKPESDAARLRKRFGPGAVQPIVIDPDAPAELDRAFEGVTGALLVSPFGNMGEWHSAVGAAAKRAGVELVVKVSVTGARPPDSEPPPGRIPSAHYAGELALTQSGVPSTMIRPTIFAQHFLGLSPALFSRGDGSFHLPIGDAEVAFVDCRDIARCAAALVLEPALRQTWAGRALELTGPRAVGGAEIAETLSAAAKRRIEWVDGAAEFSTHAAAIGARDGVKAVYAEAAGGWFSEVQNAEFREIAGRATTSFAKFVYDNRAHFQSPPKA